MGLGDWNRIPGTPCTRGLIELHRDGSLYGSRVMDVYDETGAWVMTVGGRDVTSNELDELVRRWHTAAPPFVRDALEAL